MTYENPWSDDTHGSSYEHDLRYGAESYMHIHTSSFPSPVLLKVDGQAI